MAHSANTVYLPVAPVYVQPNGSLVYVQQSSAPHVVYVTEQQQLQSFPAATPQTNTMISLETQGADANQKSSNAFKRMFVNLLDIEPIRPLLHEFEINELNTKRRVLLLYSLLSVYILSLIDVISDLLLLVQASMGDGCIAAAWNHPDTINSFHIALVFLWISSMSALFNTVVFKYVYAFRMMRMHNLSLWNAIKYVGVYTNLKTSISDSRCCNRHQWTRIIMALLEDLIQIVVGTIFFLSLRRRDAITEFSIYISLFAICDIIVGSIFWLWRDCMRCICKPFCALLKCYSSSKWRPVCACCRCCFVAPLPFFLMVMMLSSWIGSSDDANTQWNRGYQVADVAYHIDYMYIALNEQLIDSHDAYIEGVGYEFELNNVSLTQSFRATDTETFLLQKCVDQRGNAYSWWSDHAYPVLCINILNRKLQLALVYTDALEYESAEFIAMQQMDFEVDKKHVLSEQDFELYHGSWRAGEYGFDPYNFTNILIDGNLSLSMNYTWTHFVNCDE